MYTKEEIYDPQTTAELMEHYHAILKLLGENAEREGLLKTPERVAKCMQFLTKGYNEDPAEILRSAIFKEDYKQMVIVKFKEINDMDKAATYRNKDILIDREDAMPLAENEFYICDLIGLKVITDEGEELGVLSEVLQTGANDVFEVTLPNKETALIPYIEDCVKEISLEEGKVVVHILPGLLD